MVVLARWDRCLVDGIVALGRLFARISALLVPPILLFCRGIRLHFRALTEITGSEPALIVGSVEKVDCATLRVTEILLFLSFQNFPDVIDRHLIITKVATICLAIC